MGNGGTTRTEYDGLTPMVEEPSSESVFGEILDYDLEKYNTGDEPLDHIISSLFCMNIGSIMLQEWK